MVCVGEMPWWSIYRGCPDNPGDMMLFILLDFVLPIIVIIILYKLYSRHKKKK